MCVAMCDRGGGRVVSRCVRGTSIYICAEREDVCACECGVCVNMTKSLCECAYVRARMGTASEHGWRQGDTKQLQYH